MTTLKPFARLVPSALALLLGLTCAPARAENHALILWIGDYAEASMRLPGINQDAAMARKIAAGMGVRESNIIELRNQTLRRDGISAAFATLASKISDGDKVFIYYSGHGAQVVSPDGQSKCMEGMVSYEPAIYDDRRLEADLRKVAERASQVVMMNDSCFSGGAATTASKSRSMGDAPVAKVYPLSAKLGDAIADSSGAKCGDAVNMKLSRSLEVVRNERGMQMLYIAAAAENEVSFATQRGSTATLAWAACLSSNAADYDHSGTVNGEELRRCAQDRIDTAKGGQRQTITLRGNAALPLSFATAPVAAPPAVAANSATAPSVPGATSAGAAAAAAPVNPERALEDIRASADQNIQVALTAPSTNLRIGTDMLDFSVSTNRAGYLYLLQVGSDGKTFNLLFPNREDSDNFIGAGTFTFPRDSWRLRSAGPEGTSHLLAILSPTAKDIGKGMDRTDVFATAPTTVAQTRSLVVESTGARAGGSGRFGASEVLVIRERK